MKNLSLGLLISAGLLCSVSNADAQILKKIGQKVEKKVEKAIDKALDDEATEVANEAPKSRQNNANGPFESIPVLPYDFKAGTEVIFFDDFSNDSIGAMAARWTSNGTGSTATPPGFEGRWLRLYHDNTYKIKELVRIPENFTLEFDLLTLADSKGKLAIDFGFDHQKGISKHYYLAERNPVNIEASYRFDEFEFTSNELGPRKSSKIEADMSYFVNDVMKVKIRVQDDRMAAYINEYKVLDTEMVDPMTKKYFYIAVENEQNLGEVYLDNVRITKL